MNKDKEKTVGCIISGLILITQIPIYLYILYSIITALELTQNVVIAFWAYVVLTVILALTNMVLRLLVDD